MPENSSSQEDITSRPILLEDVSLSDEELRELDALPEDRFWEVKAVIPIFQEAVKTLVMEADPNTFPTVAYFWLQVGRWLYTYGHIVSSDLPPEYTERPYPSWTCTATLETLAGIARTYKDRLLSLLKNSGEKDSQCFGGSISRVLLEELTLFAWPSE